MNRPLPRSLIFNCLRQGQNFFHNVKSPKYKILGSNTFNIRDFDVIKCKGFSSKSPNGKDKKRPAADVKPITEFDRTVFDLHFITIDNLGYKLKLAALYCQVTEGPNLTPEPPKCDTFEHCYWVAWKQLGDMSKKNAEKEYLRLAKERLGSFHRDTTDILINN